MTPRLIAARLRLRFVRARARSGRRLVTEPVRVLLGRSHRENGLRDLAGTWSEADLREFERDTAFLSELDELRG